MPVAEYAKITNISCIAKNFYSIEAKCETLALQARAGQFVNIKCGDGLLLRRPISVCDVNGDHIRLVFEVRGEGTKWLSERQAGEELDLLGPLGNGYPRLSGKTLLVGGGIGVPPMLYLSRTLQAPSAVLGFRSKDHAILIEDFEKAGCGTHITTDDGSLGECGTVTKVVESLLGGGTFKNVAACGPAAMLRAVSTLCKEKNIPCFVSLEERMACGIGACLVCSCKVKSHDGFTYQRVCRDGPVFNALEVDWE